MGLQSGRVGEFVEVTRCFKCQGHGHVSRFCNRPVRCGEEGHHVTRCARTGDAVRCVNCKRAGFWDTGHSVQWRECSCVAIHRSRMVLDMIKQATVRFVQVNLDRSIKASAELRSAIQDDKIQMALVQEPYVWKGKVCGLGNGRLFYSKKGDIGHGHV